MKPRHRSSAARKIIIGFSTLLLLCTTLQVQAQALLRSGPMLGYNTMREVAVWVQTDRPAEVTMRYWPVKEVRRVMTTTSVKTQSQDAFCARLIADSLHHDTQYEYQILLDGRAVNTQEPLLFTTQKLWAFRSDPPEFTFAMGSCFYANEPAYDRPGNSYGGEYKIFQAIDSLRPEIMLWLGDNIYLRPGDFQSESAIHHRYSHSRSIPELQNLLRNSHHYAIWDDHDYGPNDSDRSYIHKDWTRRAFDLFWAKPPAGVQELQPSIAPQYAYGDAEFFLLDNRTFRAPNECKSCDEMPLLGEAQLDWLIDALLSSSARFKFVAIGGQVLNPAKVFENYSNAYAKEREELLERIQREGIKNVVFLSGDRHHTELSMLRQGDLSLFDFTVSPLTSSAATRNGDEGNTLRVEGTYVNERNFGTITLSGPRLERTMTLRIFNSSGKMLWEKSYQAQ